MYKTLTLPLLATLFMHGLILAIILIGMPDAKPLVKKTSTQYIQAQLLTLEKPKSQPKPKPQPEPKPQSEQKPQPQQEAAKQREQEKQRAEQQRQQQLQQKKVEQERQAKLKQDQLAKEKVEQQAKQKEQERLAEQKRRLLEQQERELTDMIEQENAAQQAASDTDLANSYIALITKVIQNNWDRPPSARNNMEAELALQLVPTGEVVSVRVVRGSGNAAFDRSAEQAVLRAGRFPELQQLPPRVFEKYFRRLNLRFKPEDLRL